MRLLHAVSRAERLSVLSLPAFLTLCLTIIFGSTASAATLRPAPDAVAGEYIVQLHDIPAAQVPVVAEQIASNCEGRLLAIWTHALKGFWIQVPRERLTAVLRDPRVAAVEENARVFDSGAQVTGVAGACTTDCLKPQPEGSFDEVFQPHPLAHLARISHRLPIERLPASEFSYTWSSKGAGVNIYIVDSGVLRHHQEFYPPGTTIQAIEESTRNLHRTGIRVTEGKNLIETEVSPNDPPDPVEVPRRQLTTDRQPADLPHPLCSRELPNTRPIDPAILWFNNGATSHGMACASVAAGETVGVAKGATIVPVKMINCNFLERSDAALITAFDWIAGQTNSHGAVISFSGARLMVNGARNVNINQDDGMWGSAVTVFENTVQNVIRSGIPVVASANNQETDACLTTPARLSRRGGLGDVISVGGLEKQIDARWRNNHITTENGPTAAFAKRNIGSNYGPCVDIWAPAEYIPVADGTGWSAYRPHTTASGTSFAAPAVAGIIARLMAEDPSLLAGDRSQVVNRVWERLASTATVIPPERMTEQVTGGERFGATSPNLIAYVGGFTVIEQPAAHNFAASASHTLKVKLLQPSGLQQLNVAQLRAQWYRATSGAVDAQGKPLYPQELVGDVARSTPLGETQFTTTAEGIVTTRTISTADGPGTYWARITGPCADGQQQCVADTTGALITNGGCTAQLRPHGSAVWVVRRSTASGPNNYSHTIKVSATPGTYTYHWRRIDTNGTVTNEPSQTITNNGGDVLFELTVPNAPHDTQYQLVIAGSGSAAGCTLSSTPIQLKVCTMPYLSSASLELVHQPGPISHELLPLLDAEFQGDPATTSFQWFEQSVLSPTPRPVTSGSGRTLRVNPPVETIYFLRASVPCRDSETKASAVPSYVQSGNFRVRMCSTTITATPAQAQTLEPITLTATSNSTKPVRFEWLEGAATTPFTEGQSIQVVVPPGESRSYNVRSRGEICDGTTATPVTLTGAPCNALVTTEPVGATVRSGDPYTLTVAIANPSGSPATIEWRRQGPNGQETLANGDKYTISSTATGSTLRIHNVVDNARYWAVATKTRNGITCTDASAEASVFCCRTPRRRAASHSTVVVGQPVALWVEDDGDGVQFQWYKAISNDDTSTPAGTGASITVPAESTGYWVEMTRDCGAVVSRERTDVTTLDPACAAPQIEEQPQDNASAVASGSEVRLSTSVEVSGMGPFAFQWFEVSDGGTASAIAGADGPSYSFTVPAGQEVKKTVFVQVTGCGGKITTSNRATLSTIGCPVPKIFGFSGGGLLDNPGEGIELRVIMDPPESATDQYSYQWFRGNGQQLSGSGSSIFVSTNKMDTFYVRVTKSCQSGAKAVVTSPKAYVWVYGVCDLPPLFVGQSATSLPVGDPSTVTFTAFTDWKGVKYQWYRGTSGDTRNPISGDAGKSNQLTTNNMAAYWVRASLSCGAFRDSGTLTFSRGDCSPVVVTQQPASTSTGYEQPVTLSAGANTTPRTLSYTWYEVVPGSTTTDIAVPNGTSSSVSVAPRKTTRYYAKIGNISCGGGATTLPATVRVATCGSIAVNSWPAFEVWVDKDQPATLTVDAQSLNSSGLSYQWFRGELGDESSEITGQVQRTLVTENLQADAKFWVRVTNDGCLVDSHTIVVRVCERPAIKDNYTRNVNSTVPGQSQWLGIAATGTNLKYQWYRGAKGDERNPVGRGVDQMRVNPQTTTSYWIKVTGSCGIGGTDVASASSDTITVSVCPSLGPITVQDPEVMPGTTTRLTIDASGTDLQYQWYRGRRNDFTGSTAIANSNSPSILTPPITGETLFWVTVTSGGCTIASEEAFVTTCSGPSVLWNPTPVSEVKYGHSQTLAVNLTPEASYTWYKRPAGSTGAGEVIGTGAYWRDVYTTEDTTYWVRVQRGVCYADAPAVTVRVCVPEIVTPPAAPAAPVNPGAPVSLTVGARGGSLHYQWFKGAKGVTTEPVTERTTTPGYSFSATATATYWVRVTNDACNRTIDSDAVTVKVCEPLNIVGTNQPLIERGQGVALSVSVYGTNPLTYKWYQGAVGDTQVFVGEGASYTLSPAPQSTTDYWVRVTDACGNVKDAANKVSVRPVIDAQPQSRSITSNTSTTLTVAVSGAQLGYQWYRGAAGVTANPVGTSSASFTTPNLTAETSYWVRITSGAAVVDSEVAVVSICPGPAVTVTNTQVSGAPVELRVNGSNASMSYSWYVGAPGNTSTPAGSGALITVYPTVTTTYWCRQSNGSCTGDSAPAEVVICKPAITQQPQGAQINVNGSHTMSVAATGNPVLKYQWYVSGGSAIAGATSSTYTATPGSTTTSYFCRVTNGTGAETTCYIDSAVAKVTVCQPPAITAQPASVTTNRGQSRTLAVTATGTNPTYQWYIGASGVTATPINGATAASLQVTIDYTTDYWVRVTACGTSVNSQTARVSVTPNITAQPASVRITSGTTATFSVGVDGNLLSYRWYRSDGVDTGGTGSSFTTGPLTADTSYFVRVFSGAAYVDSAQATAFICAPPAVNVNQPSQAAGSTVTLSVANAVGGDTYKWYRGASGDTSVLVADTGTTSVLQVAPNETTSYWVRATSATCHANSATVTVVVCQPKINTQPQPASITQGQTATLSVAAVGTPTLTYQWYAGASGTTSSPVGGATAATLNIAPSTTTSYWVRVQSGGNAACAVNSAAATVTVCNPPAITQQPQVDPPVNPGTVTGMRVSATGSSLTYQWYLGVSGDTSRPVFGNTNNPTFTAYDTQYYWVRISNGCGSVNSNHALVSVNPTITAHPASVQITRGTSATFSVAASGTYLTYQWYYGASGDYSAPISGATAPTYTTPALNADATYFALVRSGQGSAASQAATASICASPILSVNNPSQTSGASVTLSVTNPVGGETYRWYRGSSGNTGVLVADTGATAQLTIAVNETSTYWVRATRASCYADSAAETVVICYPKITAHPAGASINEGSSATLSVAATGTAPLTYQWYVGASGNTSSPIAGATAASLTVTPGTTTSYWVQVKGSCAVNSNAATVNVCNIPRITTQPAACAGMAGYGCTLSVTASGSNLTYQWYTGASGDMSRPVNGRTASSMTLANSVTEYYWVRVSNGCGSVNSQSVPLSIAPVIWTQPAWVAMSPGSTATFAVTIQSGTYLSYQWYRNDGVPVGTNSPTYVTPGVTTAYSYYCIITSGTAKTYSNWAGVEFCDGPPIYSVSASGYGSCRYLNVDSQDYYYAYTYAWYRGARGDTSNYVGASTPQVCPTSSTTYWVRVTNPETGCYTDSQTLTVP